MCSPSTQQDHTLTILYHAGCNTCFILPQTATPAGMFLGSALLGLHMALTHSITISMVASYMPQNVPGLGKISGTAVSFTDLILGEWGGGTRKDEQGKKI